jgi:DNA-binding NarL/FixJ family response regulator
MTDTEALLSEAERDVLALLLDGMTNAQIAREIGRSDKTVKNHISHILIKTRCATRRELTVQVYKEREKELRRKLRAA